MAIRLTITCAALLVAAFATPAFAKDSCKDGTAPAGWKRPGGYCDISRDLRGALPFTSGGYSVGVASTGDGPYGPVTSILYRDADGHWTTTEPSGPHATAVYHDRVVEGTNSDGSTKLFYRY